MNDIIFTRQIWIRRKCNKSKHVFTYVIDVMKNKFKLEKYAMYLNSHISIHVLRYNHE